VEVTGPGSGRERHGHEPERSNKGGDLFDIYWISTKIIDELRDKRD